MSFILFLFILGLLIVVHEFGHFIAARKVGVRVEKFSLGFGPQLARKVKGDTEYSLSALPFGGYVKLAGDNLEEYQGKSDEYFSKPPGKRFWIIFGGPLLNYVMGILCFWFIFWAGYPTLTTKVGGLLDGFGASRAGVKVGDTITSVDGKPVSNWEDLQQLIQQKRNQEKVSITVRREEKVLNLIVGIQEKNLDDQLGQKRKVGLLGITPFDEIVTVRHGFIASLGLAFAKAGSLTVMTLKSIGLMITGKLSMRDSVTGPLGIFFITSQAATLGAIAVVHLIAILSISLGIFNLLPLPVLDGGHVLFLFVEKIRGKMMSVRAERIITRIGASFIISLALFVTYVDVMRLFGDKLTKLIGR
jgi:regulator of sigma E protease